jgi:hypothetical protein
LPGGGQVLFPMRRLVALYGHPGDPSLGALGEQDLRTSIARARKVARQYRRLSSVPVIPAFEIIATVAEAHPGPDGSYSYESPLSLLGPWVKQATAAGMYVVLDLQAGRASLLAQAKRYEPLLKLPNVGLALDPEWKLGPRQVAGTTASTASADRQPERWPDQRGQQLAGGPDRAGPPAAETPRAAPVPAVDDQQRAPARYSS